MDVTSCGREEGCGLGEELVEVGMELHVVVAALVVIAAETAIAWTVCVEEIVALPVPSTYSI